MRSDYTTVQWKYWIFYLKWLISLNEAKHSLHFVYNVSALLWEFTDWCDFGTQVLGTLNTWIGQHNFHNQTSYFLNQFDKLANYLHYRASPMTKQKYYANLLWGFVCHLPVRTKLPIFVLSGNLLMRILSNTKVIDGHYKQYWTQHIALRDTTRCRHPLGLNPFITTPCCLLLNLNQSVNPLVYFTLSTSLLDFMKQFMT